MPYCYVAKTGMVWAGYQAYERVTGWYMSEEKAEDALERFLKIFRH